MDTGYRFNAGIGAAPQPQRAGHDDASRADGAERTGGRRNHRRIPLTTSVTSQVSPAAQSAS